MTFISFGLCVACAPTVNADARYCEQGPASSLKNSVSSPDGHRTALLFETNGGATTPFGANVCVQENGKRRLVTAAGRAGRVEMTWLSNTRLQVSHISPGEPAHEFEVAASFVPLIFYRNGGLGCSAAKPCPRLYHCASSGTCWRDGHDPDPGVVRTDMLHREGTELVITFDDGEDTSDTFTWIDAGQLGYEATRYRYPTDRDGPVSVAISSARRARLLTAASSVAFRSMVPTMPTPGGRCARVVRSRSWHNEEAYVCAPATVALVDEVARLLKREWP